MPAKHAHCMHKRYVGGKQDMKAGACHTCWWRSLSTDKQLHFITSRDLNCISLP